MKKIKHIRFILLFIFTVLFIQGCGSDLSGKNDTFQPIDPPKNEKSFIHGTWEISDIEDVGEQLASLPSFQKGDKLYVSSEMVAIENNYTTKPMLSGKYVLLKDYLDFKYGDSFKIKGYDDENITVFMIQDKDLFSLDLLKLSESKICFFHESRLYYLEKIDSKVAREVINEYMIKATNQEISRQQNSNDVNMSVLIGVRTDLKDNINIPLSTYSTYLITDMKDYYRPRVFSASNIYVAGDDNNLLKIVYEVNYEKDDNKKIDASFSYYESKNDEGKWSKTPVVLQDTENRKITFVDGNTISFSKNLLVKNGIASTSSYEIYVLNNIDASPLKVSEISGEDGLTEFKNQILNDLKRLDTQETVKPQSVIFDENNIGITRKNLKWVFETTKDWNIGDNTFNREIDIDLIPNFTILQKELSDITWTQILNVVPNANSAFISSDSRRILVETDDEIQYFKIDNGRIDNSPMLSIQIPKDSTIVSTFFFYDTKAELINNNFYAEPLIQSQVIYPIK